MAMLPKPKSDLASSTVWAIVVVVLAFLTFLGFLINAGKTPEVRSILVLVGQGFIALMNIFIVYRSTLSTNRKIERVDRRAEEINSVTEQIRESVNGKTPPPGTLPAVDYVPEH